MSGYKFQKHWYLGFLGFIGIYEFSNVLEYFYGNGTAWKLTNVLWFLWFLYFLPEQQHHDPSDQDAQYLKIHFKAA